MRRLEFLVEAISRMFPMMATEWDGSPFSILVRIRDFLLPSDSGLGFFAARIAGSVVRSGEDSRNFVMIDSVYVPNSSNMLVRANIYVHWLSDPDKESMADHKHQSDSKKLLRW